MGSGKALWTKQQESSPGTPPCPGLHSARQLGSGVWAVAGPTWSFPVPSHVPSSLTPKSRGASPSGYLGTPKIKPSSVQKAPKSWGVTPRRGGGRKSVGRCLFLFPGPEARARHGQGWQLGSLGNAQISVRASAGTRPRFLPLLTRMKPSASLLLPTPTQI